MPTDFAPKSNFPQAYLKTAKSGKAVGHAGPMGSTNSGKFKSNSRI